MAIVLGIGIFALDVLCVFHTMAGLASGKIRPLGKSAHALIFRSDDSNMFWFQVSGHFLAELLFASGAICLLIFGIRQLKR